MQATKLFAFASQFFFRRALPHGIIHWRYMLPQPTVKIGMHRRLWLMSRPSRLPSVIFFLSEFILWLRWVLFSGWRSSWRAVQFRGKTILDREGISIAAQLIKILSISLGYCIPPAEIYAFGLYRINIRHDIWNYVFTHELPAFHVWRNGSQGANKKSMSLLQDKYELTKLLATHGVPMAPILDMISHNDSLDHASYLKKHTRLFCKPRYGSRSRDTYIIEAHDVGEKASIFAVVSGMKGQSVTHEQMQKAMKRDDFLIQPFLENHQDLAALTSATDVATVRVITQTDSLQGFTCYCATLEIPHRSEPIGYSHIILPIELFSGRLKHFPDLKLPATVQECYNEIYKRTGQFMIPYWQEIRNSALAAHQYFPDVYAIAWDYVIVPEGPLLLEGNTGWGTRTPQMLHGGLLQTVSLENK